MYRLCAYLNLFLFLQAYAYNVIELSSNFNTTLPNGPLQCLIKQDDDGYPMVHTDNGRVLQPNSGYKKSKTILVDYGTRVIVSCGRKNLVYNNFIHHSNSMSIECLSDSTISGFTSALVECDSSDREEIFRMKHVNRSPVKCFGNSENNVVLEAGFKVNLGNFDAFMEICFNQYEAKTLYSKYNIRKGTVFSGLENANSINVLSKYLDLETSKIKELYDEQQTIINTLLDYQAKHDSFIDMKNLILVPGQFAPHESFMYEYTKKGTFYYENTDFQWKTINEGNWKEIGQNARQCVDRGIFEKLKVYAGSYGVAELKHSSGTMVELKMYHDRFPVPALFWKVFYRETLDEGIAVLTLNNPHDNRMDKLKCTKVQSDDAPNCLKLQNDKSYLDKEKGITVFCKIDDVLKKIIPFLPKYDNVEILKQKNNW